MAAHPRLSASIREIRGSISGSRITRTRPSPRKTFPVQTRVSSPPKKISRPRPKTARPGERDFFRMNCGVLLHAAEFAGDLAVVIRAQIQSGLLFRRDLVADGAAIAGIDGDGRGALGRGRLHGGLRQHAIVEGERVVRLDGGGGDEGQGDCHEGCFSEVFHRDVVFVCARFYLLPKGFGHSSIQHRFSTRADPFFVGLGAGLERLARSINSFLVPTSDVSTVGKGRK